MNRLLVSVLLVLTFSQAQAQSYTGNWLYGHMKDGRAPNSQLYYASGLSTGYIMGVTAMLANMEMICLPANSTNGQTDDIVFAFLEKKPEVRHLSAYVLVYEALRTPYACPSKNKSTN